jgi:hypothetical protein
MTSMPSSCLSGTLAGPNFFFLVSQIPSLCDCFCREPIYCDLHQRFHNLLRLIEEAYCSLLPLTRFAFPYCHDCCVSCGRRLTVLTGVGTSEEYVEGEKRYKFRRSLTYMVSQGVHHNVRDHLCDLPISKPPANQRNIPSCLLPLILTHTQSATL